ncbi:urease accessory protein UreF [Caproicibacter fermentans]|uniref:Urease accessory protein UreF n=1 Tax=Caproicibacter fermentans TaxID=2576756 RepID=A0A7G8T667_9FIRM|nr:urease accessory UreF family protein [Caproicibacter fermentans]QNK39108.1 hypothetical protein HCR03_09910 [Caproicibacter fermentans]
MQFNGVIGNLDKMEKSEQDGREIDFAPVDWFDTENMGVSCLDHYASLVAENKAFGQYAAAFGIYANGQGVESSDAISVFAYSQCSAVVTNCVKLIPLSQMDGQRILYRFLPEVYRHAKLAHSVSEDDIGLSLPGLDIRAMQHERLFTRQFIS